MPDANVVQVLPAALTGGSATVAQSTRRAMSKHALGRGVYEVSYVPAVKGAYELAVTVASAAVKTDLSAVVTVTPAVGSAPDL